ncbi:MAG: hypothetical protein WDW36_003699 [Sanguina aurantia]
MSTSLAPGLARKVKKILDIRTDSPDLITSLSTLSSFYGENTPAARKALRSTIEKRGLAINERFLGAAEGVIQALDQVQLNLDALSLNCSNIVTQLASTQAATGALLSGTERLSHDSESVERRSALVGNFLDQYQLTPQEMASLQGEAVGPTFFAALSRVRAIHENCRQLLRTHHQRAGLELMDAMATHQEGAYERLCRWVQGEMRVMGESDTPEVDSILQGAVHALRERPVLFKYCAEEVATARHNSLFQRFITALSRGGPGGMPRPIEIHAHDPQRYINDMLAWVHQALASEREFILALFGEGESSNGHTHDDLTGAADPQDSLDSLTVPSLLNRVFESICRPLRVRIEQVLMTQPPLLLCFQLSQLHGFYYSLVVKILGHSATLSSTLRGCRDMAQRVFYEQLKARGDRLVRNPPQPPADLTPPAQVTDSITQLIEIVAAFEGALESGPTPSAPEPTRTTAAHHQPPHPSRDPHRTPCPTPPPADALNPVLSAVLDPLVSMCERSAEALTPNAPSRVDESPVLDPAAHSVYLINCLSAVWGALSARAAASVRARQVGDMIEGHVSTLVAGQLQALLARCGLEEVVERLQFYQASSQSSGTGGSSDTPAYGLASSDPALSLPRISERMRAFFVLVSSPDALPEFPAIQVPRTRTLAVSRVGRALAESYELVYAAVEDPLGGYLEAGGAAAIKHSPAQVRTILGVL